MTHSEPRREDPSDREKRFDEEAAQRILRRAAEAQARWETEATASYTLEQLEEIAIEAGIAPEAVRAAAREIESFPDRKSSALTGPGGEESGGWLAAVKRRMPATWSPALKNAVLVTGGAALLALLVSVFGVGPVVFIVTAAILVPLLLLILLGLGPV